MTGKTISAGTRLRMPFDRWPEADQVAWQEAFRPADLFDTRPSAAWMRLPSRLALETCYARWLRWLTTHHPEVLAEEAAARATRERVQAYLRALDAELAPRTMVGYAVRLKRALELLSPGADLAWLKPVLDKLERRARARRPERPFVPTYTLFGTGLEMMRAAETLGEQCPHDGAVLYTNGLIIAFMAVRPLRLKNMIGLELGSQLIRQPEGFTVTLLPQHTKNKRTMEFPVPHDLAGAFVRYLDHHRPLLVGSGSGSPTRAYEGPDTVFVTPKGKPFAPDAFEDVITRETLNRLGQRLTPQDFRHCAATTIADFMPEEAGIIRLILGHTTPGMADRYYIHAKGTEAAHKVQSVIATQRKALRKMVAQSANDDKHARS